jgi:hypothetical protein
LRTRLLDHVDIAAAVQYLDRNLTVLARQHAEGATACTPRLGLTDRSGPQVVAAHCDLHLAVDPAIPLKQFLPLREKRGCRSGERKRC